MISRRARCLLVAVVVAMGAAVAEDDPAYRRARAQASEAVGLQEKGQWDASRNRLIDALKACPEGPKGRPCRLHLEYTFGYLSEKQSERVGTAEAMGLQREAVDHYEKVLAEAPSHARTLESLGQVYVLLGLNDRGETALRKASSIDKEGASRYAIQIGDIHARDDWQRALQAYHEAAAADPDDESARIRIARIYREAPQSPIEDLARVLPEWEIEFPDAARQGYETVIERTYGSNEALASKALVAWVRLLAKGDRISVEALRALPSSWKSEAVSELRKLLEDPLWKTPRQGWWARSNEGREALALVTLRAGERMLTKGGNDAAIRAASCWETGLNLANEPIGVRLDLETRLATLYSNNPSIDAGHQKFDRLINDMFFGKGGAYRDSDLDAVQRYHTILGLIFAQRKEWENGSRGAIFQLTRAIDTAEEVDRLTHGYTPLPDLHELLARGYLTRKDAAPAARDHLLKSVQGYLDTDDLERAASLLKEAEALQGVSPPGKPDPVPALGQILASRRMYANAAPSPTRPIVMLKPAPETPLPPWIDGNVGALPALPPDFVDRQRFKFLSDRASHGGGTGAILLTTGRDAAYAGRALNLLITKDITLVGASDIVRFKRSSALVSRRFDMGQADVRIEAPGSSQAKRPPGTVNVTLPSERRIRRILVPPDVTLAASVAQKMDTDDHVVFIKDGKVRIQADGSDPKAQSLRMKLMAISNADVMLVPR